MQKVLLKEILQSSCSDKFWNIFMLELFLGKVAYLNEFSEIFQEFFRAAIFQFLI